MDCNPDTEKGLKDGKDLQDRGSFPSIYVGETGRSLHERAREHWGAFKTQAEDSHIFKHWVNHHGRKGQPNFQIRVIKYCRDALTRQVGEAVRIGYRGQTLNSKGGYNRSGLSRLILEERTEEIREEKDSSGMEESYQEPKGLGRLESVRTGEKRKETQHKDS
jgi:hypothetical protein